MPSIKIKTGQCMDCATGSPVKPLTAGRCRSHYWRYRAQVKAAAHKASAIGVDKQAQQKALNLWFESQVKQMPRCCENCNEPLNPYAPWGAKAYVAHIVPKRIFKTVMIHPLNRVFLCIQCHTNYDNWSAAKVSRMLVVSLCMERFAAFADEIPAIEWRYLPDWLVVEA